MTAIGATRTFSAMVHSTRSSDAGSEYSGSDNGSCETSSSNSTPPTKRRKYCKQVWSEEEDRTLREAVETHGEKAWSKISPLLPGRVGKQCRDRWFNHLNGTVNKGAWTTKEDQLLFHAQQELGNQWAEIARKYLPGRTDLSVKNRYYSTLRRVNRQLEHAKRFGALANSTIAQQQQQHAIPTSLQARRPGSLGISNSFTPSPIGSWSASAPTSRHTSPVFKPTRPSSGMSLPSSGSLMFSSSIATTGANSDPYTLRLAAEQQVERLIALHKEQAQVQAQTQAQLKLLAYQQQLKSHFENQLYSTTAAIAASTTPPHSATSRPYGTDFAPQSGIGMTSSLLHQHMQGMGNSYLQNPSMLPLFQPELMKPKENSGRWNSEEHVKFLEGVKKYGCSNWPAIAKMVGTRTVVQVRTHAQKFFKRVPKEVVMSGSSDSEDVTEKQASNVVVPDPQQQVSKPVTPPRVASDVENAAAEVPKMVLTESKNTDSACVAGLLSLSRAVSS